MWQSQWECFGGRHPLLRYDRRGFGTSRTLRASPQSHRAEPLVVMDAARIDLAVLVGRSQGGRIALDAALFEPDRVLALVLVAGPVTVMFLQMNGIALRAMDPGLAIQGPSAWARLAQVAEPVLLVWGDLDLPTIQAQCNEAQRQCRRPAASSCPASCTCRRWKSHWDSMRSSCLSCRYSRRDLCACRPRGRPARRVHVRLRGWRGLSLGVQDPCLSGCEPCCHCRITV